MCGMVLKNITSPILLHCFKYNYVPLVFFVLESIENPGYISMKVAKILACSSYISIKKISFVSFL